MTAPLDVDPPVDVPADAPSEAPIAKKPPAWRSVGRPFKPGQSGNPKGKRAGLEKIIRETVGDDIEAIIRMQITIAKGKLPDELRDVQLRASDITKAAEWLTDRGWGKARQVVDISAELSLAQGDAFGDLTDEQLEALAALDVPSRELLGGEGEDGDDEAPDDAAATAATCEARP